jgi:hypothetical protein
VYVKMESLEGAQKVQSVLHGRWFAGQQLEAHFFLLTEYQNRFPDA